MNSVDVILSPLELPALARRDLRETVCVVFDVLRATSTFVTALQHGAEAIIPVSDISEALVIRRNRPDVLLGGERNGVKIQAAQTGGIEFDLGNSPREFTAERVRGKTIVSTTTNGTRALRAGAGAKMVLAASFLNLAATVNFIKKSQPAKVLIVCAGTHENPALEDVLAAGALCARLSAELSDSAEMARRVYVQSEPDLAAAVRSSQNARRLLAMPALREDVAFCLQQDVFYLVAALGRDGALRAIE